MIDAASFGSVLRFWSAVALCGLLAWPLAARLLPDDEDLGYLAAKPLGWLIGSYAAWLGTYAGIPFWRYGWLAGVAGLTALFAALFRPRAKMPTLPRILQWEAAFLAALLVGVLVKGSSPDIVGLEKFMDFGFVNAALRTAAMPPPDPWWAGAPINYYYFGHVAAAWLIQLSGVPADHGFNLMIATLFAFAGTLGYRIVKGCLDDGSHRRVALICGVAAAALVTFGGNFHSLLYGPFRAFSPTTFSRDFYYPDSTRFIGFDPPTDDKGFTEMPAYGFAVGDLHAHLLNLPTAFLILLILSRILRRESPAPRPVEIGTLALMFAVSATCNSWDAASYGLVAALAGLSLVAAAPKGGRLRLLARLCVSAVFVVAGALALASPFLLAFKPISSGFRWADAHTPLWQLAVVYGHVALPCLILVAGAFLPAGRDRRWRTAAVFAASAILLVALPEIAYVKDIYGEDHRRANTMFKLTFEAQPIAAMAGMMLVGLLLGGASRLAAAAGLVLAAPLLAVLCYGQTIYRDRLLPLASRNFTLDGFGFIRRDRPQDMALIDWLRAQPPTRHMLLVEAPGDSFTEESRLSALSGVPAFVGWRGHERLWRGDAVEPYRRFDQATAFYKSHTLRELCAFVKEHGVTHVAVGTIERERFKDLDAETLEELGPVVVQNGNAMIVEVDPLACVS